MRVAQTTTFVVVLFKFLLFAVSWRQSMGWCLPFIRRSHSRSRMCRVGTTQPCLFRPQPPARHWRRWAVDRTDGNDSSPPLPLSTTNGEDMVPPHQRPRYDLGLGKNKPKKESHPNDNIDHDEERNEQEPSLLSSNTVALDWWMVPESVVKPESVSNRSMTSSSSIPSNITTAKPNIQYKVGRVVKDSTTTELVQRQPVKTRRMVA